MLAHDRGIKTWVSLEPVIDPEQALILVDTLHRYVSHWKVGKINHHPEAENGVDWVKFREQIKVAFAYHGITDYYIKRSLSDL